VTILALIVAVASLWGVAVIRRAAKEVDASADNLYYDLSFSGAFGSDSAPGSIATEYPKGEES